MSGVTVRVVALFLGAYLVLAGALVVFGGPPEVESTGQTLVFDELGQYDSELPELQNFEARDGKSLSYRRYPADVDLVLVLVHGSGWHSRYLSVLADAISGAGTATVVTPDLRGHGLKSQRRGDIDYPNQLEDDLADLIEAIRHRQPQARVLLGGHSSGGGLAIRFAGSRYGEMVDGYLLLAPFLRHDAPTVRPNSGGWARPAVPRIIGLSMFQRVGIDRFDHLPAITFDLPEAYRDGTETLSYSYRLMTGFAPKDYQQDLAAITQPTLLLVGSEDEAFYAEQFASTLGPWVQADVVVLPRLSHLGVVVSPLVVPVIDNWLQNFIHEDEAEKSSEGLWSL